jgi:Na+-transporting methylmalonyl-CoA/oxaloacetate decarboxylase gamma subunit
MRTIGEAVMSDQWHAHTSEEDRPQLEHAAHVSPKWLALTFIGMVFGVLFVIIVLVVYFNNYMSSYKARINETTVDAESAYYAREEVRENLTNPDAGLVQVSINDAMELVIAEYAGDDS